jgi:hypothetical protein
LPQSTINLVQVDPWMRFRGLQTVTTLVAAMPTAMAEPLRLPTAQACRELAMQLASSAVTVSCGVGSADAVSRQRLWRLGMASVLLERIYHLVVTGKRCP